MKKDDCIFCKIVAGELPSNKVYEDEDYLAFLDIAPMNPGHTLVIPKAHYDNVLETPAEVLGGMMPVVQRISRAVIDTGGWEGFALLTLTGRVAGQMVDHIHFHIMPRKEGDGVRMHPPRGYDYAEGEAAALAEKLRGAV